MLHNEWTLHYLPFFAWSKFLLLVFGLISPNISWTSCPKKNFPLWFIIINTDNWILFLCHLQKNNDNITKCQMKSSLHKTTNILFICTQLKEQMHLSRFSAFHSATCWLNVCENKKLLGDHWVPFWKDWLLLCEQNGRSTVTAPGGVRAALSKSCSTLQSETQRTSVCVCVHAHVHLCVYKEEGREIPLMLFKLLEKSN